MQSSNPVPQEQIPPPISLPANHPWTPPPNPFLPPPLTSPTTQPRLLAPAARPAQASSIAWSAAGGSGEPTPTTVGRKPLAVLVEVPGALWRRMLRPVGHYGFRGRSVWEGGVGLFMVTSTTPHQAERLGNGE